MVVYGTILRNPSLLNNHNDSDICTLKLQFKTYVEDPVFRDKPKCTIECDYQNKDVVYLLYVELKKI